jgi:hypothetical protein
MFDTDDKIASQEELDGEPRDELIVGILVHAARGRGTEAIEHRPDLPVTQAESGAEKSPLG